MRHDSDDCKILSQRHKLAHQSLVVVCVCVYLEPYIKLRGLFFLGFCQRVFGLGLRASRAVPRPSRARRPDRLLRLPDACACSRFGQHIGIYQHI
jgi:hypothetical protein